MAQAVVYLRGPFPPDVSENPAGFVKEAKFLLAYNEVVTERIASALVQHQGFLSFETTVAVIDEVLRNRDDAEKLARLLVRFAAGHRDNEDGIARLMNRIAHWKSTAGGSEISDADWGRLAATLRTLIRPYPGLLRFHKAKDLSKATGYEFERFRIICDVRPVYDSTRESIEGYIPFATVKLVCTGEDGLPRSLEAIVSPKELASILEDSKEAVKKMSILSEELTRFGARIPSFESKEEGRTNV